MKSVENILSHMQDLKNNFGDFGEAIVSRILCNTSNVQNYIFHLEATDSGVIYCLIFHCVKLVLEIFCEKSLQIQYEKTVLLLLSSRPVK